MTDRQDSDVDSATGQVRVFVNYRRNDTRHVAGRLRDLIVARFGKGSVFVDVDSIEPGLDYVTAIDTAVGSCDVMLVLIGDRWLEASDDEDHRRIDDPADRLRIEIESGLRNQTRVIPVLVDSASMPTSRDLPAPLVPLARHQSTRLRHESFHNDADHLLGVVERVVGGNAERTDPRPPSTETDTQRAARWLSFGILLTALLALLALRSGVRDSVVSSRPQLPPDGPWASLVWLLPSLPVLVAAWLVANRDRLGVALGLLAGAAVWVATSFIFVVWREQDSASAHLLVLALLFGSIAGLVVAVPPTREHVRINPWHRVLLACVLVVVAVVLRAQSTRIAALFTSTETGQLDWGQILSRPPFWIAFLVPVLICLPGAFLLGNKVQAQVLLTLAFLQILYPVVLRAVTFRLDIDVAEVPLAVTDDLVFIAGSVCMLLAVLVGQRRART